MEKPTKGFWLNLLAIMANVFSTYWNIYAICTASIVTGWMIFLLEFNLWSIAFVIYVYSRIEHMKEIGRLEMQYQQLQLHSIAQTMQGARDMITVYEAAKKQAEAPPTLPEPEMPRPITTGALQHMELTDKETK